MEIIECKFYIHLLDLPGTLFVMIVMAQEDGVLGMTEQRGIS